jgi:hypothetical protein
MVNMMLRRAVWPVVAVFMLAAGALLPKCEGPGPRPFTRVALTAAERQAATDCSRAYGQCQVTEYIHVRRDGSQWVETCFAAPAVVEGHGNVRVAVAYCYRP